MVSSSAKIDLALVHQEFGDRSLYFNTGCSGRKPNTVIESVRASNLELNKNPCDFHFLESNHYDLARETLAGFLQVPSRSIFLALSTSYALQFLMQSFLLRPGDELVTTDDEHGSLRTIAEFLAETRGIIVRTHHTEPMLGSGHHCEGLLNLVNNRTRLVAVSEIGCYTGWRPKLARLVQALERQGVPLLVDGAHAPGQGRCLPGRYPMWVGSGHKWLGGPSGTAFGYVRSELIPNLQPVALGDKYLVRRQADIYDLSRFEFAGTSDVSKWVGLAAAIQLHMSLNPEAVARHQIKLAQNLRERVALLQPTFRVPRFASQAEEEATSMVSFCWPTERVRAPDLKQYLWKTHRIAVQYDFLHTNPGHGMRISCHISNTSEDIDQLVDALRPVIN